MKNITNIGLALLIATGNSSIFAQNNKIETKVPVEVVKKRNKKNYEDWKKVELSNLSFYMPNELTQEATNCFDSACYTFKSENLFLSIDISSAVGYPSTQKRYASFTEKFVWIDGAYGSIWYFEENKENDPIYKYKSGVVFRFPKNKDYKIGMSVFSKKEDINEIGEKIFKSAKFKKHK